MSDVMLFGVLRMPYEMAMGDELSRRQFWDRAQQAADEITRLRAENEKLRAALLDGNRPLPFDRDTVGRMVREAWVRWAETQPAPKPSWLVPYDELSEADKEADRQIGESVARWTLIYDAARAALGEQA